MKNFTTAFNNLRYKIEQTIPFAFSRFSDGELFIMQNKTVILADNHYVTGDIRGPNIYTEEEQKEFLPERDGFYREKLLECYKHIQPNYFKGICTGTDAHVGDENFDYQIKLHGGDHESLTFSNLLINANYKRFVEEIVPLLSKRKVIYVVNKLADISRLPFKIEKAFRIGSNCMINDYGVVEEIKSFITLHNIKDHVILCSAASLSNFIIYENFKDNPNNTFLDIGSCLNPLLNLEGWKHTRGYLTHYWLGSKNHFGEQVDQWG